MTKKPYGKRERRTRLRADATARKYRRFFESQRRAALALFPSWVSIAPDRRSATPTWATRLVAWVVCGVIEAKYWHRAKRTEGFGNYQKVDWETWRFMLLTGEKTCQRAIPA